jgi:alanyl-tRNA synthetase
MSSKEIVEKFINFYEKRGHKLVPNVSLVPENDPTLLFVNSGMFPLVPYLSGQPHPQGKRLMNIQRSLRFEDMDEIGDRTHTVAFHMLGNWSLSDYFKKEQLPWVYELLIEEFKVDPNRLFATVFAGEGNIPADKESIEILKEIFSKYGIDAKEGERIFAFGKKSNWWKRGEAVGELGGPDSEVFYYLGEGSGIGKNPEDNEGEFLEIGNSVFMQYRKTETGWEELSQKNVDFGGGLERIAWVIQGKEDIFETDNFYPIIQEIEQVTGRKYKESPEVTRSMRILADHMRASVFLAMDGVVPSNKEQGYVLRRLLRRMTRVGKKLGVEIDLTAKLVSVVAENFSWLYPDLSEKTADIVVLFAEEELKFRKTLEKGQKELDKRLKDKSYSVNELAKMAFDLYQSMGFPSEIFLAEAIDRGISVNRGEFDALFEEIFKEHQSGSRAGAEMKFKGGLADQSEQVTKYHTATHLLHQALRTVLGPEVFQQGSNITKDRLRFDFNYPQKLTESEIKDVENIINEKISNSLPVKFEVLPIEEAKKTGAVHFFGEKYGEQVNVYYIGENMESAFSKEFCGGPHVANTSDLAPIEIYKQESIGKGKQRVYAHFK